jgi:hypothetical protein
VNCSHKRERMKCDDPDLHTCDWDETYFVTISYTHFIYFFVLYVCNDSVSAILTDDPARAFSKVHCCIGMDVTGMSRHIPAPLLLR